MNSLRENYKEFVKNKKLILKLHERYRSQKHDVFTGEVNNIALSGNNDKRIQSIDSVELCAYGTSKKLVCKKQKVKRNNIIKQYKND